MTEEVRSGPLVGRQIAGYRVLALLGAGGMGEVYRARDTRLGRDVALKVLQGDRAGDPAQQARFRREAQAASALNHPNILAVYDVGVEDGISFIITELVDGISLREKVAGGPLPIKELLDLATQIAEGLTAAHEADIVHRDLKPENLMVTRDGRAKILDFGLALAPPLDVSSDAGTLPVTRTETGLIQGTVPYMSPEQARGAAGDFRSDQFAFGLILYEMTTGTRAFRRETPVQTLSAIIADEPPPITGLTSRAPAPLRWLIERCLAKDPRQRYAATRDLAHDLRTLRDRPTEATTIAAAGPDAARRRRASRILFVAAVTVATLALGIDVWVRLRPTDVPLRLFVVPPPKGADFTLSSQFVSVSPDGQSLVFVTSSPEGKNSLWLRRLDSLAAVQLPGTDGGAQPYWSPDSRFVAFGVLVDGTLRIKKIDVSTRFVETLDQFIGTGTWNADDIIVGPRDGSAVKNGGLSRISAKSGGGSATAVTTLDDSRGETAHRWPNFLPDGRHFLFVAVSQQREYDGVVYIGSLDSTDRTRPLSFPVDSQVVYVAPGYLLYMLTNTLWAVPFDAAGLRVTGSPVQIVEHVECTFGIHSGAFSVSKAGGVLAYRLLGESHLTWFDRGGHPGESIGSPGLYGNPALSPNEQTVAVNRLEPSTGRSDIWLIDLERGTPTRFTFDPPNEPSDELMPLWFPNGSRLMYRSNKKLPRQPPGPGFYSKALSDGGAGDLVLADVGAYGSPLGWSPDGSLLYDSRRTRGTDFDLWTLPPTEGGKPVSVLGTQSNEARGQLSPDGHWMAYVSDSTGRQEVYVKAFPLGDPRQISMNGGIEPRWGRDATELFYLALDHWLMSVAMTTSHTIEPGTPRRLFETRMSTAADALTRNQYVVRKDGQRLLINQAESPTPITVVLNWTALLKR
jgi:serine/threonine protein kinase